MAVEIPTGEQCYFGGHSIACVHSDRMIQHSLYDRDDLVFIYFTSYQIYAYFLKKNPPFRRSRMKDRRWTMDSGTMANYYKQSLNSIINKSFHRAPLETAGLPPKRMLQLKLDRVERKGLERGGVRTPAVPPLTPTHTSSSFPARSQGGDATGAAPLRRRRPVARMRVECGVA